MVHFSFTTVAVVAGFFAQAAFALPSPTIQGAHVKRAPSCTFPTPPKTSSLSAAKTITGTFDGKSTVLCSNIKLTSHQVEMFATTVAPVLALAKRKAATRMLSSFLSLVLLSSMNVVIGANQAEGIHCKGSCTITNVWFESVCEDAITIKQTSGTSTISGGGAKGADDKVIQHNGGGTVNIDSYCVEDFGKLYRSCGNCSTQYKRTVNISNIIAKNGKLIAGVNSNYGDVATIKGTNTFTSVKSICNTFKGNSNGDEPTTLTTNVSNSNCKF
ncbi:unnamed protein product [Rhizoctonia solani]|uniref:Pectate lyase n=1 Tax=Rhizoctonia solani TaxID=456999 RepID=A0A8H3GP57_9AGAM|nr:unnamed protein product [Rhizoctonia solani]